MKLAENNLTVVFTLKSIFKQLYYNYIKVLDKVLKFEGFKL